MIVILVVSNIENENGNEDKIEIEYYKHWQATPGLKHKDIMIERMKMCYNKHPLQSDIWRNVNVIGDKQIAQVNW